MTNATEEATAAIKQLAAREIGLLSEQIAKKEQLAVAEANAGDAYLESSTTIGVDAVLRIQSEIAAIGRAITSCRGKRLAAVQAKLDAEVADLRQRAATARQQAEAITAKTKEHLAALRDIEGVDHTPQGTPHSASAANMAGLLERQAAEMERRGIRRDRQLHVDNVRSTADLLIAALEDPSDGPSAVEILRWRELIDPDSVFRDRDAFVPAELDRLWCDRLLLPASRKWIRCGRFCRSPAPSPPMRPTKNRGASARRSACSHREARSCGAARASCRRAAGTGACRVAGWFRLMNFSRLLRAPGKTA